MDRQKRGAKGRYAAPVVMALLMILLMAGVIRLFLWAFEADPAGAPPAPVMALLVLIPAGVILGVLAALIQRLREIRKGEEDEARKY